MALLTRCLQLNDAEDTHVFNFVVTKSVTRDLSRDVVSKDFVFASQRWGLAFTKQDKTLGIMLVWRSPSDGVNVSLNLSVTLLNREFFAENRTFSIKRATFNKDVVSNGNANFIKIGDLLAYRPKFTDTNGEFQVEIKLGKVEAFYEKEILIKRSSNSSMDETEDHLEAMETMSNEFTFGLFNWTVSLRPQPLLLPMPETSSWAAPIRKALQQQRMNSLGGGQDMDQLGLSVSLQRQPGRPLNLQPSQIQSNNRMAQVNALNMAQIGFSNDLFARLTYKIAFVAPNKDNNPSNGEDGQNSNSESKLISEEREEILAVGDRSQAFAPRVRLSDLYSKRLSSGSLLGSGGGGGYIRIRVDLYSAFALAEFHLHPNEHLKDDPQPALQPNQNIEDDPLALRMDLINSKKKLLTREKSITLMINNNGVGGIDSDNNNWQVECDLHSNFLRCSMYYQDVSKIPRNHLRFLQWKAFLVRRKKRWRGLRDDREQLELIEFQPGHCHRYYYAHDDSDPGIVMETSVPSKDVRDGLSEFLDPDGGIKVRIQWEYNYLLFQATFNQYDEVARFHNIQMRAEISNLTEKIRRLEVAQANQRRQQAIAMAALAAEKLNSQKLNGDFQSDSNLPNAANYASKPNRQRLVIPVGKRLLLKPHLSLDSGMGPNAEGQSSLSVSSAPKTAPTTPLGPGGGLRRPPLNRAQSHSQGSGLASPYAAASAAAAFKLRHQRSTSQRSINGNRLHRSVSPQPRTIVSSTSDIRQQPPTILHLQPQNSETEAAAASPQHQATFESKLQPQLSPRGQQRQHHYIEVPKHAGHPALTGTRSSGPTISSNPNTPQTSQGISTAVGFMRLIAPLKHSLSVSADNLPKPLSLAKNLGRRPSQVSKCQSID